jgi:propanol-preferring alcohol dehydrogenase
VISEVTGGGCQGVLCLATSPSAFKLGDSLCRRKGILVLVGLLSGCFDLSIFEVVLKRIAVRGSIVGTREDMRESF